ncbi:MAG: TolC family protein [Polyangiales bacterium]
MSTTKSLSWPILLGVAILGAVRLSAAQPMPPRHVDEFVRLAVEHYPGIAADKAAVAAAQARLTEAKFAPFSTFAIEGAFGLTPGAKGTPTYSPDSQIPINNKWGPIYGLRVEGLIPLYSFGKIRGLKHAAEAGVDVAEHQVDVSLSRVVHDVRRAYFGLQLALDTEQMLDEGLNKLETRREA